MTPDQIQRIRAGFEALAPQAGNIVDRFYENLFSQNPGVRPMFPDDMSGQKKHLASAIALVVKHADNLEPIRSALMEMGARHVGYGAQPEHYPIVRDTLVATLGEIAGSAFTPEDAQAWTDALNAVASIMIEGAAQAGSQAA
jgi:methyl-accepting chemotaxis protein